MKMLVTVMAASVALMMTWMVDNSQAGQLLPDPYCTYCTILFRSQGCLEKENPLCKMLALKFTLNLNGDKLCDKLICNGGYGQNATEQATSCKNLLSCPVQKLRLNGICPLNQVCCAN